MVTVILKVVEMTLLKYPKWEGILPESNAYVDNDHEWTMPYYFSDEIASKPYNHNR